MKKIVLISLWGAFTILGFFAFAVLARVPYVLQAEKTEEAVAKIHATKLTLADVTGENLPPEPSAELKDATVRGIDANDNGIRDDVELAIFAEYPDSAKTRAALLQYALALQTQFIQEIVNTETVIAVSQERIRAAVCIGDLVPMDDVQEFIDATQRYDDFIRSIQINTDSRDQAEKEFLSHIASYSDIGGEACDIDLLTLSN